MAQRHKPGSPTIAVGDVRASTERQELGPDAQRAELARWAQRNTITLVAVHEDALSGGTEIEDRPGLLAVLEGNRCVSRRRSSLRAVGARSRACEPAIPISKRAGASASKPGAAAV